MNERLMCITISCGQVGVTLGNTFRYYKAPFPCTLVAVEASPSADDADLTLDVNNVTKSTTPVAAMACAVKATPGTWVTTHFGGVETPAAIAKNDVLSFDANGAAADTDLNIHLFVLTGE
jgi:hypothetical protein